MDGPRRAQRIATLLSLVALITHAAALIALRGRYVVDEQQGSLLVLLLVSAAGGFGPDAVSRFVGRLPLVIAVGAMGWLAFAWWWLGNHG